MPEIVIVNYHKGNLSSVLRGLEDAGARAEISDDPDRFLQARSLVLPGVGSFEDAMDFLETTDAAQALSEAIVEGTPFLGICLGQHLLLDSGFETESGSPKEGLGIIGGQADKLNASHPLKIPHVGWDQIRLTRHGKSCPILQGIEDGSNFYFTHSYIPQNVDESCVAALTDYGQAFPSVIWKDRVFAVQFHPEKSSTAGIRLLRNFVQFSKECS